MKLCKDYKHFYRASVYDQVRDKPRPLGPGGRQKQQLGGKHATVNNGIGLIAKINYAQEMTWQNSRRLLTGRSRRKPTAANPRATFVWP
ncbi:MAG TPA: hypothetical protein VIY48_20990 [Candidatus Paceibacterota bacterium]